ncbi:MAG TPA: hypothetical protein VF597_00950 [Candidatus Saccharimonadales bacterium]|jgi:hypothetical protein
MQWIFNGFETPSYVSNRMRPAKLLGFLLAVAAALSLLTVLFPADVAAVTTVPTKMNFQGRLTNAAGITVPDGTYNIRLKLYTVSSAGTAVWSEDRLVSAGQGVVVTKGLFTVKLGDVTTLPATLFASGDLYLEIELPTPATATTSSPSWTEGAMTPRNQLATSAYAYNSETLDGLDSADFAQTAGNNTWSGTNAFNGSTLSVGGSPNVAKFSVGTLLNADTTNMNVTVNGGLDQTGHTLSLKGSLAGSVGTYYPREMDVVGNYVYLINQGNGGPYSGPLTVIDVTNPAAPAVVGSLDHTSLTAARDVRVVGRYAYIATFNDTFAVVDISDPSTPTYVASITNSTYLDEAHGLEIQGKYAYVGASNITNTNGYLTVIDISNPANPTIVSQILHSSLKNARQVDISGRYAYVTSGATSGTAGLSIIDISNPLAPTYVGSYLSSTLMVSRDVVVNGKYAYIVSMQNDTFAILDISNPATPTLVGSYTSSTNINDPYDITLNGRYAYIAGNASDNVSVIDISNPATPTLVSGAGYTTAGLAPMATIMNGRYLYVGTTNFSASTVQFRVLDTSGATLGATTTASLDTNNLQVEGSADIYGELNVHDTLTVGQGGIRTDGSLNAYGGLTAGNGLFQVDAENSLVRVGPATADGTAVVFVLDTKNTAGDPTGVNGAMYYNSNAGKFRCYEASVWKDCIGSGAASTDVLFVNTSVPAGNTLTNTVATDQAFASAYTVPANDCQPGRTYRITARGVYTLTTAGSYNATMKIKWGTTTVLSSAGVQLTGAQTNRQWQVIADIICQTSGTTGTIEGQGGFRRNASSTAAVGETEMVSTAAVTINTTTSQSLQLTTQFATANSGDTMTLRQFIVEAIGP